MIRHPPHKMIRSSHHRRPSVWQIARQTARRMAIHALRQLADGHAWTALALSAMAGLAAIPADVLASRSWLRIAAPIALAGIGIAVKGVALERQKAPS